MQAICMTVCRTSPYCPGATRWLRWLIICSALLFGGTMRGEGRMQTTAKRLQIQHIQAQGAAAFDKQTWVSQLYRVRFYRLYLMLPLLSFATCSHKFSQLASHGLNFNLCCGVPRHKLVSRTSASQSFGLNVGADETTFWGQPGCFISSALGWG